MIGEKVKKTIRDRSYKKERKMIQPDNLSRLRRTYGVAHEKDGENELKN